MKVYLGCLFVFNLVVLCACGQKPYVGTYFDTLFRSTLVLQENNNFVFYYPPGPNNYTSDTFLVNGKWAIDSDKIVLNSNRKPKDLGSITYTERTHTSCPNDSITVEFHHIVAHSIHEQDTLEDGIHFIESIEVNNNGSLFFRNTHDNKIMIPKNGTTNFIIHRLIGDYEAYNIKNKSTNYIEVFEDLRKDDEYHKKLERFNYFDNEKVKIHGDYLIIDNSIFLKRKR